MVANIKINEKRCKQCGLCQYCCPHNVYSWKKGSYPVPTNVESCTSCKLCEMRCPDFAIEVGVEK